MQMRCVCISQCRFRHIYSTHVNFHFSSFSFSRSPLASMYASFLHSHLGNFKSKVLFTFNADKYTFAAPSFAYSFSWVVYLVSYRESMWFMVIDHEFFILFHCELYACVWIFCAFLFCFRSFFLRSALTRFFWPYFYEYLSFPFLMPGCTCLATWVALYVLGNEGGPTPIQIDNQYSVEFSFIVV